MDIIKCASFGERFFVFVFCFFGGGVKKIILYVLPGDEGRKQMSFCAEIESRFQTHIYYHLGG